MIPDRALDILARPGALRWFVVFVAALYFGLWLFGFERPMPEQLRSP